MDDDMYCDADQAGGVFSFENIGRMEAAKTSSALLQIENLLLQPNVQSIASGNNSASSALVVEEEMPFEHYRRIESEGYDAHCERVDMKEVLSWQSAFPYFAARGGKICPTHEPSAPIGHLGDFFPTLTNNFEQKNAGSIIYGRTCTGINDLVVEGRKCNISERCNDRSEVNITDGILEELIAVHVSSDDPSAAHESEDNAVNLPSPHFARREEIVSLLLDALWPEVIEVCKPLVQKVVEVSRRENITYDKGKIIADENDDNSEGGYASW
jgi:hypothetical protein